MDQQLDALHTIATRGTAFLVDYSFQVVGAIIILIGDFLLGSWVSTKRCIETIPAVNLAVYQAFGQANIPIPFPQRVVTIMKDHNLS